MGILGFFRGSGPTPKSITKQISRAKDPYSQSEYRVEAMKKLLQWSTKESLLGALERFSIVVQSPHWDEEEKSWLKDELQKKGSLAKEAIIEFIGTANAVTHPIQVLSSLCTNQEEFANLLHQSLQMRPPEDYRSSQAKREIILALQLVDLQQDVATSVCKYLNDQNDDVRCAAIDFIKTKGSQRLKQNLVNMLGDQNNSSRVLRHAASTVRRLNLNIQASLVLSPSLQESYVIEDSKLKKRFRASS